MAPRWQPGPDVVSQRLDDEVVLFNLRTNKVFSLNRTGARVWELMQTGHDWRAIRDVLLEEFDVQPEELDSELDALAASLDAEGFVPERGSGLGRSAASAAPVAKRRRSSSTRGARKHATALLLIRMGAWSLALPLLKRLLPLPTLVRLMSAQGPGGRCDASERQIVRNVGRIYRLRRPGTCLERSLLAYRYLSKANAGPMLVIGVRRNDRDVIGHAWVLVDGSPLYESSAYLDSFLPVVEFAPDGFAITMVNGLSGRRASA